MKNLASIKTRITVWYTLLMLVMISIVLASVGTISYRLSTENIEKNVKLQVSQVSDRVGAKISKDIFHRLESDEEFKNVSVYLENGDYVVGRYSYDVAAIPFDHGRLRHETVGNEEYVIFDIFKPSAPGDNRGYWIRGAQSISYARVFGDSAFIVILICIPFILLLTAAGGYYITKKAFMPINGIINTASDIAAQNDISRRIEINSDYKKDELYNLSVTLNSMLDRIEKLVEKEKRFTSDAAHELRTPVSVVLAQGEYLLDIAENEKEKELAQNIVDKAKQMSELVSGLLLIARIDGKKQRINKEKVDLAVLADIAAETMREEAEKKNILLLLNVSENIIIEADEALLLSVLTNLIGNGIKYGRENGYVSVSAFIMGDVTEIIVADNGIGMAEEQLDKIWDRFYRVDDVRNDEYGSSGLGLAMVKSIVELHGGNISVKSETEKGSEFRITLYN